MSMLFRRYARSDIKPTAYAHFAIRTITAVIIAWAVTLVLPGNSDTTSALVIAFVVGFFPDTGLTAIFEFVKNTSFIKTNIPSLAEKYALERLDGINIYHRARLIDEGIENMENLAHAELIELILQTRRSRSGVGDLRVRTPSYEISPSRSSGCGEDERRALSAAARRRGARA